MEHNGEKILVADDDPYIGKVLTDRLQSLGHQVLLASRGKEVLELLDSTIRSWRCWTSPCRI